ncbi:unnamed protein product [Rotaria sp. Silwood2]|nr:unnamed protein product [Rotaria sp. Silwood2]CAF4131013.1 unnamed protein product [Rotaria sp. Silwood2]
MDKQPTLFEDLPVELFHVIFEYLAPHDLFMAFNNLNQRFTCVLTRQPLFIPNNRNMNISLYFDYLTSIIPNHLSQIVYLHLSERYAPHALDYFISTVPLEAHNWPALKAVIIEDVPFHALEILLDDNFLLSKAHFLSIDIGVHRYHHSEYNNHDFDIILPILEYLPELRSLYIRMHGHTLSNHSFAIDRYCPPMIIHQNLHTLMIHECSRELLVLMLNDGHLSQLCRLHVSLACSHEALEIEPPCPTPLKSTSVPKLRYISIHIMVGLAWVLNYFEELQHHSQLEYLKISGHVRFTLNNCVPRVSALKRWLLLNKLKEFKFEMKLLVDAAVGALKIQKRIVKEYNKAIGIKKTTYYRSINLNYSALNKTYKNNKDPRVELFDVLEDVDEYAVKMELMEMDYISDTLLEYLQSIDRWHCLRKISLTSDILNVISETIGENIPLLLHIAQRAPYFREFYIEGNLKLDRILSSSVQLGILFMSQIEIFSYTAQNSNYSLGDLVKIVDRLFAHSSSSSLSPILKELTLNIDGPPSSWLTVDHLFVHIEKILDRFPALIHFTLNCQHDTRSQNDTYNLLKLAPLWHQRLLNSRPYLINSLEYRYKTYLLEIWL